MPIMKWRIINWIFYLFSNTVSGRLYSELRRRKLNKQAKYYRTSLDLLFDGIYGPCPQIPCIEKTKKATGQVTGN